MPKKVIHEGYFLVDHSSCLAPLEEIPYGRVFESATSTCKHCQRVIVLNPNRSRPRHYCPQCDDYICDNCELVRVSTGVHESFEQFADRYLNNILKGSFNG